MRTIDEFIANLDLFEFLGAILVALVLDLALTALYFGLKRKHEKQRAERERVERELIFSLPDKENSFLRDRLNTTLKCEQTPPQKYSLEDELHTLSHARELLTKLKAQPLSPAERVEVDGISRTVTAFAIKNDLTAEEVAKLNERLATVVKLSAKYSV